MLIFMTKPQANEALILGILDDANVPEQVRILAVRGYYSETFAPAGNNVGVFDDAMFLCAPGVFRAVQANTDPSRLGWNPGVGKPYAMLMPGLWYFRRGPHKGKTPALRQCTDEEADERGIPDDGEFEVLRCWGEDDPRNYKETGYFAINVHRGGDTGTSSWGCQTIPPDDFDDFMAAVWEASKKAGQNRIPYLLIEGPIT